MSLEDEDALALSWLDRLLDTPVPQRAGVLDDLQRQQPALVARVGRLLDAAQATGATRGLPPWPQPADRVAAGRVLGGWRLVGELGRGGMSQVWLARSEAGPLTRHVALKIPLLLPDRSALLRFEQERDVLASLSHPGIAMLLDSAVDEAGRPFFVLEHVEGERIDTACDRARLGLRGRLLVFMQVLAAVEHAHRHAVVHRDLKPSNVLVDGEGRARLLDFGIAKVLHATAQGPRAQALTGLGEHPGTLLYAAPEQVAGGEITVATDIYALGVMLFELLAGASPYGALAGSTMALMLAIRDLPAPRASQSASEAFALERAATPLARWRRGLRGDLDTIVAKALAKRPEDRYASVERFIDDLRRHLERRPIAARRTPWPRRLGLAMRRHVGASVAGGAGLVASICLAVLAATQYLESMEQGQRAERVRDFMFDLVEDAEPDEHQARGMPTGADMVDGAIRRVQTRFADRPRLQGELLAELARMKLQLPGQAASTPPVDWQRRAVALLERHAPASDPALNKARTYLADSLLDASRIDEAEALARQALSACRSEGAGCAKARSYAANELGRIALLRGRPDDAVAHMQRAVEDTDAGFGPREPEAALARLAHAIAARKAGRLDLARASLSRAMADSRELTLRRSDRHAMLLMAALVDMDLGRHAEAESRLQRALAGLSDQPGDQPTRLRFLRVLATVQMARGEADRAMDSADSVLAKTAVGIDAALALQVRSRALAQAGRCEEAARDIAGALRELRALGYAEPSAEIVQARSFQTEARAHACIPALIAAAGPAR